MRCLCLSLLLLQAASLRWQSARTPSRSMPALKQSNKEPDILEEQIKEFVEGVEQFQKETYTTLYGKEVRLFRLDFVANSTFP